MIEVISQPMRGRIVLSLNLPDAVELIDRDPALMGELDEILQAWIDERPEGEV